MSFSIEQGIPIPNKHGSRTTIKYPLDKMNVGDSFLVECDSSDYSETNKIRGRVQYQSKTVTGKFVTRKVEKGVRIWRSE